MSETPRVLYQNKLEKQCISLAFIIRMWIKLNLPFHSFSELSQIQSATLNSVCVIYTVITVPSKPPFYSCYEISCSMLSHVSVGFRANKQKGRNGVDKM